MRELKIEKNDAGQRLDRYLSKALPALPSALAQKFIRTKYIKRNGKRAQMDDRLEAGDVLQCYISDEFFDVPVRENLFLSQFDVRLDILYEDEHLLLVNKAPGVVVHSDEGEKINTLINHIQAYLYQSGAWDPYAEHSFTPALCNRIDRNTGGIVIAAKTAQALRVMNQKIRDREVDKRYLCLVQGCPEPENGTLRGFVVKDAAKNQVSVRTKNSGAGQQAVTKYRTIASNNKISLVECELVTGRTHQIRAMLAHAGHPLVGDPKYGKTYLNKEFKLKYQALWSWKLTCCFTTDAGELNYLNGKSWQVPHVDFVDRFFPELSPQAPQQRKPSAPGKKRRRK